MIKIIIWIKPYANYIFAIWIITIIVMSSIPSLPVLKIHTQTKDIRLDYLIHFCQYGILAFLAFLSFTNKELKLSSKKLLILTISLLLFAFLDEFHQKFIPGRSFNTKDIISNISGIMGALIFYLILFGMIKRR